MKLGYKGDELATLVLGFLDETAAPQPLRVAEVIPNERPRDAFCRLLRSGSREILILVNTADEALGAVEIDVRNAGGAQLLFADGATLSTDEGEGDSLRLSLRDVDTYALIELHRAAQASSLRGGP